MVKMREIQAAARQIARQFHLRQIWLFGSYSHGVAGNDSDVDILILMEGRKVHDHAIRIRNAIDFPFAVDLIFRSPAEFKRRIAWGDQFLKGIAENGKVLYESADTGVDKKSRGRFRRRAARTLGSKVA